MIANGAIVGSYFKKDASGDENTENPLNRSRIKELMAIAYDVRAEKKDDSIF